LTRILWAQHDNSNGFDGRGSDSRRSFFSVAYPVFVAVGFFAWISLVVVALLNSLVEFTRKLEHYIAWKTDNDKK